jgi:carbamoyltransferase
MEEKYVSFDGWWGGYSNIRMTYEMVAAISIITNRTIILPPKLYCLFLSEHHDKSTFFDMWNTLDIEAFKKEFKCVHYEDIPEYSELENDIHYFFGIDKIAKLILFDEKYNDWGVQQGIYNTQVMACKVSNTEDFKNFQRDRELINLDCEDKFIHFPRNLFGHFYYHIYGDGATQRNVIKEKIKNGVRYKEKYFDLSDRVKNTIGFYNSVHIRRNDFLSVRSSTAVPQLTTLLGDIKDRIPNDLPLYIATDEKDKSLFDFLKENYKIYFLEDFYSDLENYEKLMIDQIICSKSEIFLGSKFSTFSDYINVLRGYAGNKLDFHREGTNFSMPKLNYDRFPWEVEEYGWEKTWDYCWKYERNYFNLGFFGSHNSAVAISYKGDILEVVELERWVDKKNAAFYYHFPIDNPNEIAYEIYEYFKNKYGAYFYDNVVWNSSDGAHYQFPAQFYEWRPHHYAHVCNAIYQSNAQKSLNISFDGGSDEGVFNIYLGERGVEPKKIFTSSKDLAVCYQTVSHYLNSIKRETNWWWGNLVYAGKVMGLAAYGNVSPVFLPKFREFYEGQETDNVNTAHERFQKIFEIDVNKRFEGNVEKDLARTNQFVFEEMFKKIVTPFIEEYKDRELQFSGGGAMNIINNTLYDAFVTPNPDDRGIALGLVLSKIKPKVIDSTYLGSYPYDELPEHDYLNINKLVDDLLDKKIVGVIQGRSEYGARALGNRSIICMPYVGMKDKLNFEVKNREWFRPFAPIVRLEDASEYFKFGNHSRWMCHNAIVKTKYKNELDAITHFDGTARLQTITKEQNPFIYEILSKLKESGHIPVLLNTSFNIQGKPILNTYKDAIQLRDTTGLDMVITDNCILK